MQAPIGYSEGDTILKHQSPTGCKIAIKRLISIMYRSSACTSQVELACEATENRQKTTEGFRHQDHPWARNINKEQSKWEDVGILHYACLRKWNTCSSSATESPWTTGKSKIEQQDGINTRRYEACHQPSERNVY